MGIAITLTQLRMMAKREKRAITALVIFADDSTAIVEAGPRGGWRLAA